MVQLPRPLPKTTQTPSTAGDECMFEDPIEVAILLLPVKEGGPDQSPPQSAGVR
jgi:hypothetical protein